MSTRSIIGFIKDGFYYSIYCHHDGYLSYNGRILLECYTDFDKVENMVNGGDMSSLGETIDGCTYYARDRGESAEKNSSHVCASDKELNYWFRNCGAEYVYIFVNGIGWYYSKDAEKYTLLTQEEIEKENY